jgi:hypothetical protein
MRADRARLATTEAAGQRDADPNWPTQGWQTITSDISGYISLIWHATISPRRFYSEWADGKRDVLNPLAATLNAIAVLGVAAMARRAVFPSDAQAEPWWFDFIRPVALVCYLCVWGILCHGLLWLLGARRPLRTTVGATLYCFSGPLTLARLVFTPLFAFAIAQVVARGTPHSTVVLVGVPLVALGSVVLGGVAVVSAQQQRGWRAWLAIALVLVAKVYFTQIAFFSPTLLKLIGAAL